MHWFCLSHSSYHFLVTLFWIRLKIKTNKLKELQNNLLNMALREMSYRNFNLKLHLWLFLWIYVNDPKTLKTKCYCLHL